MLRISGRSKRPPGDFDINHWPGARPAIEAAVQRVLDTHAAAPRGDGLERVFSFKDPVDFIASDVGYPPDGRATTGRMLNWTLRFGEGNDPKDAVLVQFCERSSAWSKEDLVRGYWSSFHFAAISAAASAFALPAAPAAAAAPATAATAATAAAAAAAVPPQLPHLLEALCPPCGAEATVTPAALLSAVKGMKSANEAAAVIADFMRVLEEAVEPEPRPLYKLLATKYAKMATFHTGPGKPTDAEFKAYFKEKDDRDVELEVLMPSLSDCIKDLRAQHTSYMQSWHRIHRHNVALSELRRLVWRFPRDCIEGGVVYDFGKTREELLLFLQIANGYAPTNFNARALHDALSARFKADADQEKVDPAVARAAAKLERERTLQQAAVDAGMARPPGRSKRKQQRGNEPTALAPDFHWPLCPCGSPECPTLRPRPNMGGPPSGAPPPPPLSAPGKSAQPACESDFTFLGVDPGEGNCVTVAGIARTGFGNRLGRGPRKPPKPQRMQSKKGRRSRRSNGARRRKEPPVATHVFRLGEYDAACGRAKHLAQAALWLREVADEHKLLSTVSRKSTRVADIAAYNAVMREVALAIWKNRCRRRVARAALTFYLHSLSACDSFWAKVKRSSQHKGSQGTIIGYGDATWARGRAPNKRLRESAVRTFGRANVIAINEFNTSKSCHACGCELQGVVDRAKNLKKGLPAGAPDRGLKRCNSSSCSSFWDRDVNVRACRLGVQTTRTPPSHSPPPTPQAALNMLKALLSQLRGEERPAHLRVDTVLNRPFKADFPLSRED